MKDATLLELAKRWEQDAGEKATGDFPTVAADAYARGRRETLRECADTLRSVLQVAGEPSGA